MTPKWHKKWHKYFPRKIAGYADFERVMFQRTSLDPDPS